MAREKKDPDESDDIMSIDPLQVKEAMDVIKRDGIPTLPLLKWAQSMQTNLAHMHAVTQMILKGEATPHLATDTDFANLQYVLKLVQDIATETAKLTKTAIDGTPDKQGEDGLASRFAELLRQQNKTSIKTDLGTFSIKADIVGVMPSRDNVEKYVAFRNWVDLRHPEIISKPSVQWQLFQSMCKAMFKSGEEVPDFLTIKAKEVVRIYNRK